MDRSTLIDAFINRTPIVRNNQRWLIQSLELEDGSGYNFNALLAPATPTNASTYVHKRCVFVRCRRPDPINL